MYPIYMKLFFTYIILLCVLIGARPIQAQTKKAASPKKSSPQQAKHQMKQSKVEIQKILESYKDKEGAIIQQIKRVGERTYEIDILTNLNKCLRSKVIYNQKTKTLLHDKKVMTCD
jgi:hypothetical protein